MITARKRLTQPAAVATLVEMRSQLHVEATGSPPTYVEDDRITDKLAAATDDIDAGEGWLGRALMPQQWRIQLDQFPGVMCENNPDGAIFLPYPPLISVDSVRYRNASGAYTTLVEGTDYAVNMDGNPHGFIAPLYQQNWPFDARYAWDAVEIVFTCGYDADASPANPLPLALKEYVMMLASSLFMQRELDSLNTNVVRLEQFRNSIMGYRVFGP